MSQKKKRRNVLLQFPAILGMVIFAFFSGLRYNPVIDKDFLNYWEVAKFGNKCIEYERFEIMPKLLADIVQFFNLPPSAWFIMAGGLLIFFTMFAASRQKMAPLHVVFVGFVLLYLSFDMNVMRQGVALSSFLCAITYISEKNWKKYLLFALIALGFHTSTILWTPLYFFSYLHLERRTLFKLTVIGIASIIAMVSLVYLLSNFGFLFAAVGMESATQAIEKGGAMDMIEKGSGLGVIIRYLRWFLLFIFIPKIAKKTKDANLILLFSIFVIGVVMDYFTMYIMLVVRVSLYPKIVELLLYAYLLRLGNYIYVSKPVENVVRLIVWLQVLFLSYVTLDYFSGWNFVLKT